jgi:hypothetical protein
MSPKALSLPWGSKTLLAGGRRSRSSSEALVSLWRAITPASGRKH